MFIITLLTSSSNALAYCYRLPDFTTNCNTGAQNRCVGSGDGKWCCTTTTECANPDANRQETRPGGGNSNPITEEDIESIEEGIIPGFKFNNASIGDLFGGTLGLNAIIFFFAGFALILYLIAGGFQLMTSAGNPDAAAQGKGKITNALIGFVIIFTAFWIVQILGSILGLEGITTTFG